MFEMIETPAAELTLQQKLVREVMAECGKKLKAIEENHLQITKCETLSALLRASDTLGVTGNPVVSVHLNSITAWVQVGNKKLSTVRNAIHRAGLNIYCEDAKYAGVSPTGTPCMSEMTLTLVGFDCPVIALDIVQEATGAGDLQQAA